MKKVNSNIIVFCVCFLFIAIGLCSNDLYVEIIDTIKEEMQEKDFGFANIERVEDSIDSISTEKLSYQTQMIDLSSLKENIIGTKVFKDRAKAESGNLINMIAGESSYESIYELLDKVEDIRVTAETNQAKFLYCAAPNKEYYETLFDNVPSYAKTTYNNLIDALSDREIPNINLVDALNKSGIPESELFFHTDHHWKPYSGFVANKSICEELHEKYGFEYDLNLVDINNYEINTYDSVFLGSHGRRTGRFFSWYSSDDFDVITPRFPTDFCMTISNNIEMRQGSFENTLLYKEHLKKDYYNEDCYNTYCGNNARLQIIKNILNPEGKKVLILKDSFAMVVIPFLSLQTSELHIVDNRIGDNYSDEKVDIEKYIEDNKPDYVIMLYSGINILL